MAHDAKKLRDVLDLLEQIECKVESLFSISCRLGAALQQVGELSSQLPDLDSLQERAEMAAKLAARLNQAVRPL